MGVHCKWIRACPTRFSSISGEYRESSYHHIHLKKMIKYMQFRWKTKQWKHIWQNAGFFYPSSNSQLLSQKFNYDDKLMGRTCVSMWFFSVCLVHTQKSVTSCKMCISTHWTLITVVVVIWFLICTNSKATYLILYGS